MLMKSNNVLTVFCFNALLMMTIFQSQAESLSIKSISIAAPISAPFIFKGDQEKTEGFLVELFALVQQKTGLSATISVMPWARGMHEVKVGHIDALMPTIYTDERAQFLAYPKLPLIEFHTVLLKRAQDNIVVNDITKLGTNKTIVKIRGMSMGKVFDDAEKSGLLSVIEVRDFDHAIQMLATSRADLVACVDYISNSSLKRLNLRDQIDTLKFSNEKVAAYLAFSKTYAKHHNIKELMQKINKVKSTPEYKALVDKYLKKHAEFLVYVD